MYRLERISEGKILKINLDLTTSNVTLFSHQIHQQPPLSDHRMPSGDPVTKCYATRSASLSSSQHWVVKKRLWSHASHRENDVIFIDDVYSYNILNHRIDNVWHNAAFISYQMLSLCSDNSTEDVVIWTSEIDQGNRELELMRSFSSSSRSLLIIFIFRKFPKFLQHS